MAVDHVQRGPPLGMTVGLRQIALHDQAAAVLHQRMAHEAEHRAGAGRFLVEPRVGIGGRDMRRVRPLLAPEVDLGIAVTGGRGGASGRSRMGSGSGWSSAGLSGPGGSPGSSSGGVSVGLRLEALHRCPSLHQRAVDREVVVRQERRDLAVGQDRRHHLARHLGRQQPVAVLA